MSTSKLFFTSKQFKWACVSVWLMVGVILFIRSRQMFFFPFHLLPWVFFGFLFYGVTKWNWLRIVIVIPILSLMVWFLLAYLSMRYVHWERNHALDQCIQFVVSQRLNQEKCIFHGQMKQLSQDVTSSYTIEGEDYFFGTYDLWVRFNHGSNNGSRYYIAFTPQENNQWGFSAYKEADSLGFARLEKLTKGNKQQILE